MYEKKTKHHKTTKIKQRTYCHMGYSYTRTKKKDREEREIEKYKAGQLREHQKKKLYENRPKINDL